MRYALLPLLALVCVPAGAQPAGLSNWSFDELTLTNGAKFQGLILAERPDGVEFRSVSRPPGRPTVTLTSFFGKAEVAKITRLSDRDREALKEKLAELDPSGEGERKRMESLELVPADWLGRPGAAKVYDSDYFTLVSTGTEELTRRSGVRLEQIYTAFARFLPPTAKNGRPTKLMLATDPDEYKELLGPLGADKLLNPAVYDATANRILCGSDLRRLGTDLQSARVHHGQELEGLRPLRGERRQAVQGRRTGPVQQD